MAQHAESTLKRVIATRAYQIELYRFFGVLCESNHEGINKELHQQEGLNSGYILGTQKKNG